MSRNFQANGFVIVLAIGNYCAQTVMVQVSQPRSGGYIRGHIAIAGSQVSPHRRWTTHLGLG